MKYATLILFASIIFLSSCSSDKAIQITTKKGGVSVVMTTRYNRKEYRELKKIQGDSLEVKVIKIKSI